MNTEIVIPVPELKAALSGLNKMVGKRTTLPILSHVKISRQKSGNVSLQATDLDAHATYTLENVQEGEEVNILVPLDNLNKALKCSQNSESVALICEDKITKLRYFIGGNPIQQSINTLPVDEWPQCPEITVESTPLQSGFGAVVKEAMQCCSQDQSRYILRGACLDGRNEKAHYIVGTNGKFLYSANSFIFPFKDDIVLPDSKFINGSSLLDNEPCFMAIQPVPVKEVKGDEKPKKSDKPNEPPKYICLQSKQWQFVTKQIEGQYPNWKMVIPEVDGKWTMIKLPETAMEQMLKVIPNLPGLDQPNCTIRLRTGENCLWVDGRSKNDKEWTSIAIPDVKITGKPKETCLNRHFLLPALKFGLSELAILDQLSPMVCSNAGKKMVIMPLRPDGPVRKEKAEPQDQPADSSTASIATPSAATPPSTEVQPQAESTSTNMAKETSKHDTTTTTDTTTPTEAPSLFDQIDQIRERVKNLVRELTSLGEIARQMERDKRASEKEVETARTVLKKLQSVTI